MKKMIFLFAFLLLLCGCRNRNLSDEIYEDCKKTVEIVDDYLDKYITWDEADDMIDEVDCNYDEDNEDELLVCIYVDGLKIDFNSPNKVTTSKLRESRNQLKKECGL